MTLLADHFEGEMIGPVVVGDQLALWRPGLYAQGEQVISRIEQHGKREKNFGHSCGNAHWRQYAFPFRRAAADRDSLDILDHE